MSADQGPARRTRVLAVIVLVVTFVAGALAGMASDQVLGADEPERVERRGGRESARDLFGPHGRLTERLDLTEDQRAQIERMVVADRAKADSMFREIRPRLRARYDSTTAGIRSVLTPEQRAEFDRYRAERRERIRGRYRGNNHRRGP